MSNKVRVAINGYGNLGKAVEEAVEQAEDLELVAVFTRRDPQSLQTKYTKAVSIEQAAEYVDQVDICILCGGSATDLETQTPDFAKLFNVVDSFDTHAKIPAHFETVDQVANQNQHVAVISSGWDPGVFSINRVLAESFLPNGSTYTFWGKGVSQGHSDAIRRIPGVANAIQYTVPIQSAKDQILAGEQPELSTREKHLRQCFVVAEPGADQEEIRQQIVNMPNYFSDYDTTVEFISAEELAANHSGMPHGGDVIRSGQTSPQVNQTYAFHLALDSNPGFTGSVLAATARAAYRLHQEGVRGALTVLDIPPALYHPQSGAELRKEML